MTLPVGTISMSQVNTELGIPSTTTISLNQANVRSLAGVPSGTISMSNLQGKSAVFNGTISSPQQEINLYTWATANGYGGSGVANITISPGVYIWSDNTATAAMTIPSGFGAGNLTVINNGLIMGKGGAGKAAPGPAFSGGIAIQLSTPIILTNNSFIGGGGGGGGGSAGGGGAGGGAGAGGTGSGAGGAIGASGADATPNLNRGGGGGRIFPGTGGAGVSASKPGGSFPVGAGGKGGGAGGGGGALASGPTPNSGFAASGAGGAGNAAGSPASPSTFSNSSASGGGGGWGAAGGFSRPGSPIPSVVFGGAGGKAINLNGNSITYPATGTIWGTVS